MKCVEFILILLNIDNKFNELVVTSLDYAVVYVLIHSLILFFTAKWSSSFFKFEIFVSVLKYLNIREPRGTAPF